MLRIIQQYLVQTGYGFVAEQLAQASNVPLEDPIVESFRKDVLAGKFSDIPGLASTLVRNAAVALVTPNSQTSTGQSLIEQKREFVVGQQIRIIEYLLYEQKYMELVAQSRTLEAIQVL